MLPVHNGDVRVFYEGLQEGPLNTLVIGRALLKKCGLGPETKRPRVVVEGRMGPVLV